MKLKNILLAVILIAAASAALLAEEARPAATNSLPANADDAWKEIETASRPPPPPAEWGGKPPTPEQREKFMKFLGEQSSIVAGKAKEFYTRFPEHAKAEEAKTREQRFLQQAQSLGHGGSAGAAPANSAEDEKMVRMFNEMVERAFKKHGQGSAAVYKDIEAGLRELMKEFPHRPELWQQFFIVARNTVDKEEKKRLLTEVVNSKVADEETIAMAKGLIKSIGAIGHPFEMAFTATDGRKVDVQKMKGKVVLIDFWASWCTPCMATLPHVIQLYNKYNKEGLEIIGINLDQQQRGMEQVVHRFKMPWPQYFDGKGWGTKFALEYTVNGIPAMWLVDRKGVLRTMDAYEDLEPKIKELLAEKH
jgi:thiol-disulfide isomerase/thioredoxin